MSDTVLARRYGEALLDAASDKADQLLDQLSGLVELYTVSNEFRQMLLSPVIPADQKEKALRALEQKLDLLPQIAHFLTILVKNGRGALLPAILPEVERRNDSKLGRKFLVVTTAREWNDTRRKEFLESLDMANARVQWECDDSLIGGVRVQLDDLVWDGSVQYQLDRIQQVLTR